MGARKTPARFVGVLMGLFCVWPLAWWASRLAFCLCARWRGGGWRGGARSGWCRGCGAGFFFVCFAFATAVGGEHHGHAAAHHFGRLLNFADIFEQGDDVEHRLAGHALVGHLAAAKEHDELALVAAFEKLARFVGFELKVVVVDVGSQTHAFKLRFFSVGFGFLLFLLLGILPFAVVHDLADGR